MEITEFDEVVEITLYRNRKKNQGVMSVKDIAGMLGKSSTYARQVINGHQTGPAAQEAKQKIAKYLGIIIAG